MSDFIKYLPYEISSRGIDLEDSIGVKEVAWEFEDIIQIISYLIENDYTILGGDVYKLVKDVIEITYDNWYINVSENYDIKYESQEKALHYVTEYNKKNGSNYLYSIVAVQSR